MVYLLALQIGIIIKTLSIYAKDNAKYLYKKIEIKFQVNYNISVDNVYHGNTR
jgi:hypothetical protein